MSECNRTQGTSNILPIHLSVLSRRDYLAGLALTAMVSDYSGDQSKALGDMARDAVRLADLLIAHLDGELS